MRPTSVAIASSLLFWIATALSAQRVQTSYDHCANFSIYKTYSWLETTESGSLLNQRVRDVVNSSLAAKGLTQVSSGGELGVFASDTSEERQKLVATCRDTRGGWGGSGFGGGPFCDATTTTKTYIVNTLAVEIFDANSTTLLWHASSTETLSGDSNTNIRSVNREVEDSSHTFLQAHASDNIRGQTLPKLGQLPPAGALRVTNGLVASDARQMTTLRGAPATTSQPRLCSICRTFVVAHINP